jgi:hypothetical protein
MGEMLRIVVPKEEPRKPDGYDPKISEVWMKMRDAIQGLPTGGSESQAFKRLAMDRAWDLRRLLEERRMM